jgi:hypothetical protein
MAQVVYKLGWFMETNPKTNVEINVFFFIIWQKLIFEYCNYHVATITSTWTVTPCSLVDGCRYFRGAQCLRPKLEG